MIFQTHSQQRFMSSSELHNPDPVLRYEALEALRRSPAEAPAAAALLEDPVPNVREQASRVLKAAGTREAARQVATIISSSNISARNLAGETLKKMGHVAVPELLPYLTHEDNDVRKFAIDVLARLPARIYAPKIAEALDDPDANVRLAAIEALGELKATNYADELKKRYEAEPSSRPNIVQALGAFQRPEDLPFFEQALLDENPVVQLTAAEALASIDVPETLDLLVHHRTSVNSIARSVMVDAVVSIVKREPARATELPASLHVNLVAMLDDPDPRYQKAAIEGLTFFVKDGALTALLQCTGRSDEQDLLIFRAISDADEPFEAILKATDRGDLGGNTAATFALGLLGQAQSPGPHWPAIGELLIDQFHNLDVDTQLTALNVCASIGHPALTPVVEKARAHPLPDIRSIAEDVSSSFPSIAATPSTP